MKNDNINALQEQMKNDHLNSELFYSNRKVAKIYSSTLYKYVIEECLSGVSSIEIHYRFMYLYFFLNENKHKIVGFCMNGLSF